MRLLTKITVFLLGVHCLLASSFQHPLQFYSQANQDQFAYLLSQFTDATKGCYLEIGSGHPTNGNNTYFLETVLHWKGISIDIDSKYQGAWSTSRQNPLLIRDATLVDYQEILRPFPQLIDYLSLDVDNHYDIVLQKLFLSDHKFRIITIEHDYYVYGDKYRQEERKLLTSLGYYLLCPDVSVFFNGKQCIFEDWWIHPSAFPLEVLSRLKSLDLKAKSCNQIIDILDNCLRQYQNDKSI